VDPATLPAFVEEESEDEERVRKARAEMPPIGAMVDLHDFEVTPSLHSFYGSVLILLTSLKDLARDILSRTAWAYYKSAGDDEYSTLYYCAGFLLLLGLLSDDVRGLGAYENEAAFRRYWFRPRV
jgi:L-lactate dehydrogenase (cytochrome)